MDKIKFTRSITKYLIYPKFQLTLVLANTFVMITICVAIYIGSKLGYQSLHAEGAFNNLPTNHPYYSFLEYQVNLIYQHLVICFLVGILLSNIAIITISHKVAGPIIRLKNNFLSMSSSGKIEKIFFRKNDFFDDLPEIINTALEHVKNNLENEKKK